MLQLDNDEDGSAFKEEIAKLKSITRRKRISVMTCGLYIPVWIDESYGNADHQQVRNSSASTSVHYLEAVEMRVEYLMTLPHEAPRFSYSIYYGPTMKLIIGSVAPSFEDAKRRAEAMCRVALNFQGDA